MRKLFLQIKIPFLIFKLASIIFFLNISIYSQNQVANFSTGKVGTSTYEHFSFWVEDNSIGDITYSYGKSRREVKLKYSGTDTLDGIEVFKIEFPNGEIFYVLPQKSFLRVVHKNANYDKIFRWEYEGPVNGIGTWCDACTGDGKESIELIKKYFL